MSSAVGGNSILHIANRLGHSGKKDPINSTEEMHPYSDMSFTPPSGDSNQMDDTRTQFQMNAEKITFPYPPSPSTSLNQDRSSAHSVATPPPETVRTSSSATPPPETVGTDSQATPPSETTPTFDLAAAVAEMQKQFAANQQPQHGLREELEHMNHSVESMNSGRAGSEMPNGYSPWLRNAGRKKSHPVWDFFKDLKDTNGVGGVICLHCSWNGDDRSPNNLRTHLKKFHTQDGVFARFSQKLAQTPTQPYVKRARAGGNQQNMNGGAHQDTVAMAIQQLQNAAQGVKMPAMNNSALNFLENLPKSNEVINISAGFNSQETAPAEEEPVEHGNEPGSSSASATAEVERAVSGSPTAETSGGSPSVSSTNQLNAFMNMAANPLMWNAMLATSTSSSSHGSAFSLNDGQCVSMLMKMALDLDLTMSYHKRRGDIELCFESNRTAEKSGGRGKVLCLSDMGREIRVTERVNGAPTDTEMWTKTDFNQFHWAIRGKCQKVLVKV